MEVLGADATGEPLPGMGGEANTCLASDPNNCFARPQGIAINDTTGDVYVADYGNARVVRLDENGVFERAWGWDVDADDPGTGFEVCVAPANCKYGNPGNETAQLDLPTGIAVDQSNGDVYVTGRGASEKFDLDGNFIRSMNFSNLEPIAVKPVGNTLIVGASNLSWLDSSGNLIADFLYGRSGYAFGVGVGVDSAGDVYVAPAVPGLPLLKFSAAGVAQGEFAAGTLNGHIPMALAVDPVNDRVYVTRYDRPADSQRPEIPHQIAELDTSGQLIDLHATGVPYKANGLAVRPSTGRLYLAVGGGKTGTNPGEPIYRPPVDDRILVIDEVPNPPVPVITSLEATGTTATLNGTVNPFGTDFSTGYHWEYRIEGASAWTTVPVPDVDVGNGNSAVILDPQELTGLEPNTTYEVRLSATRTGGAGSAVVTDEFTTLTVPPVITERTAHPVGATSAQLRAVLNPRKSDAQYYFEYGRNDDYGKTTPVRGLAATKADVAVYATIGGLEPEATYHYRLVADNGTGGEVPGDDLTFTTRSVAEMAWPARGIELATPPDTGSQNAVALLDRTSDRVAWATIGGAPGSPTGTVGVFAAERNLATPQGWQSRSILPRADQLPAEGSSHSVVAALSPDYRAALGYTQFAGRRHFFRYQTEGERTDLTSIPANDNVNNTAALAQPADNLKRYYLLTETRLSTEHPVGGGWQVYDIAADPPRLISRLPGEDGDAPFCGVPAAGTGGAGFGESRYPMHSDPQQAGESAKVFFESLGQTCALPSASEGPPGVRNLYVRDDGGTESEADDTTTLISGPQVSGDGQTASFIRATADGREVLYATTAANDLSDTNESNDIYAWTASDGNHCVTCEFAADTAVEFRADNLNRTVLASADLRRIYFNSRAQLIPGKGEAGSEENLYYLDRDRPGDGLAYVAQAVATTTSAGAPLNEMSKDGKLLVFRSESPNNTPDSTGGFNQFFRFDATDGRVECITCPPPGVAAAPVNGIRVTGSVADPSILQLWPKTILSADGSIFAFQSEVAYVPGDINGGPDIYEWRRDGRLRLVTDGVTEYQRGDTNGLAIQGISADGRNIMFTVAGKLTGFELELTRQVFIARTGGGFPPPPPPVDPCAGDACQGPLQPAPRYAEPGSESLRGAGDVKAAPGKKKCPKGKVRRGKRCVAKKAKAKSKQAKKGQSKARGKRTGKGGDK